MLVKAEAKVEAKIRAELEAIQAAYEKNKALVEKAERLLRERE